MRGKRLTEKKKDKRVTRSVIATHAKTWQTGESDVAYFLVCGKRLEKGEHGLLVSQDKPLYFHQDQVLEWNVNARWVNGTICLDAIDCLGGEDLPLVVQLKDLTLYLVFGKELEKARKDETHYHVFAEERDLDGPNPEAMIPYKLRPMNPTQVLCFKVNAVPWKDAFWFTIARPEKQRMQVLLQQFVQREPKIWKPIEALT